ncbi:hypothetical protein EGW08_005038 [Elysia chlorotica]|uniref:Matrin-type domain-containing protein n=1 Tax=Elysia chlorotica TaxID=188477 RepID=A0A433U0C6_ELYCH|nr:hypothetical protein EGW08_005038 [Elysia chlorotica]
MMNRNRRGYRDRDEGRRDFGGHDGLLGEGPARPPPHPPYKDPIVSNQMNQLMLAQQLLQKQAMLSASFGGGGDLSALAGAMNNMQMMHQQQRQHSMGNAGFGGNQRGGPGGPGGDHHQHHRKRVGVQQDRDMDSKRRRRDSFGRSGDHDRFHGREDNRGGDGRDRVRSSRWEPVDDRPKNTKKKGNDTYDPAEPTEDEQEGQNKDLYCHVCNISVYDDASFRRHLNGTKHQARMNSVLTVHQMKSTQLQSRLKAEEHLRKIEGKTGGFDPDYFCKICNNELTIPWERHRFSNIHKQRQLQVKRGCGWCNVHDFNNFTEVLEHRETEDHKKNADIHGKKSGDKKNEKQHSGPSSDRMNRSKKKEEEEEDLTIPEFNPDSAVGQNFIIPVTGFFCKLCNKFYNNEKSAKGAHCQTEGHYEKFKAAIEVKIAAREARKAEEAATAAAEADKKAAETEKTGEARKTDTDGDTDMKEAVEEEEDFDDDLPLEDSDDEGGLVKFIANSGDDEKDLNEMESNETAEESLLNETSANGSFTFLSGEQAQALLEQQTQAAVTGDAVAAASPQVEAEEAVAVGADGDDDEDTEVEDNVDETLDQAVTPSQLHESCVKDEVKPEDEAEAAGNPSDMSGEGSGLSQEDDPLLSATPTAEVKPTRGRGTARRARGRGRGKK